jgi:cation diffusion facilitator CzcD-associated flavoprotein CzcO
MAIKEVDVIVVGAGFGGLRALHALRQQGKKVQVIEASEDVGGVWHHNGYPGARCDVESYDYSYSFSPELEQQWVWSERYATQPEILRYIRHVVERFDMRKDIRFNCRMERAQYDAQGGRWAVACSDGSLWSAHYLVLAVGQLSSPKTPSLPGQDKFGGQIIHSAIWPKEPVSFAGKRVAIIGTGSSGMQMTPVIARQAAHLTVFQRTPNYSVPAANAPVSPEEDRQVKANYRQRREQAWNSPTGLGFLPGKKSALEASPQERAEVYEAAWSRLGYGFALTYFDILLNKEANDTAAEFIRQKIASVIEKPQLREKLVPRDHAFAARRPSVDDGYFQAFNRDNVQLVDVRETPIVELTASGIRTQTEEHRLDMIIFATGFDAFTGSLLKPEIIGREGLTLKQKWAAGPVTHLGVGTAGFPNLFVLVGPGSPSLLSNVMVSIEEQSDWFAQMIHFMDLHGVREVEVTQAAEQAWVAHVNARAQETLYLTADSYYNGAEVAGKPRVFMPYTGGVRGYRRLLRKCADHGYEGFAMRDQPLDSGGQILNSGAGVADVAPRDFAAVLVGDADGVQR